MNELAYRYTEERYCTKHEVSKHLSVSMIDPVWEQIEQYRSPYFVSYSIKEPLKFCLCHTILLRILKLHENKQGFFKKEVLTIESLKQLFNNQADEQALWMVYHWHQLHRDFGEMLQEAFQHYLGYIDLRWKNFLMDPDILMECKWIMLFNQCDNPQLARVLLLALGLHHDCLAWMDILTVPLPLAAKKEGTYALQVLLDVLEKQLEASRYQAKSEITLSYQQLVFEYPQLRDYQIRFFLEHNTKGYFYTIEQFIEASGVCYETARCALEQLVSLQFYDKMKQGKKFVYTRR